MGRAAADQGEANIRPRAKAKTGPTLQGRRALILQPARGWAAWTQASALNTKRLDRVDRQVVRTGLVQTSQEAAPAA